MDHSDDYQDSKPQALPQQQQLPAPQQQQQPPPQQQWHRDARRYIPYPPQPNFPGQPAPTAYTTVASAAVVTQPQLSQAQPTQHSHMYQQTQPYPGYAPQQPYLYYQQQQPQQLSLLSPYHQPPIAHPPFVQPRIGRPPMERPLIKLSVSLIDTYKHINEVYYTERDARKAARAKDKGKTTGTYNNGWDDENYDYIINQGELIYGRYKIRERIGKGSFGQVVRAEDVETNKEVAIKIIKSKKPFLMQAKTEIELLTHLWEKDPEDEHNVVRLLTHFMYRNHQCLVFEMLSLNLYELLKNTQFSGVSLNLIRKFAKQVLKALAFLARSDVDVIHCDLKPENILLRHPKKSSVKVIDFGSSCRSNKRMYSYIQSRFYRSPEVMLGLPYTVAIDMWSLGCILAEMHTGEPLFSGSDQFDQMRKIVSLLGMLPSSMLDRAADQTKLQFFERVKLPGGKAAWTIRQTKRSSSKDSVGSASSSDQQPAKPVVPSTDPIASLTEVITSGSRQKKKFPPSEAHNSPRNYALFVDLVYQMLTFEPGERIKPHDALNHPFIVEPQPQQQAQQSQLTHVDLPPEE